MIGLILGDGHIQQRMNSRFIYTQSSLRSHHLNYFKHVLEIFKPYLSKNFKFSRAPRVRARGEKESLQIIELIKLTEL